MKETTDERLILVCVGEITLKGLNRYKFEDRLMKTMRRRLSVLGTCRIDKEQKRFLVHLPADVATDDAIAVLRDIFGIVSLSPVTIVEATPEAIRQAALTVMKATLATRALPERGVTPFKVETKRVNKAYPERSYAVSSALGEALMSAYGDRLTVDVKSPDVTLRVEIRDSAYVYATRVLGLRGLPVGMSGTGMLLLSGGIDSPVAGYLMASRGLALETIYFHTYPYTSDEALAKVRTLASILTRYAGDIVFHVVDFTAIQQTMAKTVPEAMTTIAMRRMMMRIASALAATRRIKVLITGESLGQVASQTQEALLATDHVVDGLVFRPLIGWDKDDTVRLARTIGTFTTSIEPHADCCTVFVAKHPETHPSLEAAARAEAGMDIDRLVAQGLEATTTETLTWRACSSWRSASERHNH